MNNLFLEVLILLLLILLNGLFAMTEIAIVAARQSQLQIQADQGSRAAQSVLRLKRDSSQFLATIQIGITLIGVLAGAIGGATVAASLASLIGRVAFLNTYKDAIALGLVVIVISYCSVVLGELVPKQIALWHPERIAIHFGPRLQRFAMLIAPVVRLLSASADSIVRLLGFRATAAPTVTEEEVRRMIRQGTQSGLFEPIEEEVVRRTFRLSDLKVRALMTPRSEIAWLDLNGAHDSIRRQIITSHHTRFPVAADTLEHIRGVVRAKDLLTQALDGQPLDLLRALQPAHFIPASMDALDTLEWFRETRAQVALIIDEYGGLEGLVTIDDILDAIVGDLSEASPAGGGEIIQRDDHSFLIDGMLPIHEFEEFFQRSDLFEAADNSFDTLGGFVMSYLNRIPNRGEHFVWRGLRFEVVDMDGQRVDKVLVSQEAEQSLPREET